MRPILRLYGPERFLDLVASRGVVVRGAVACIGGVSTVAARYHIAVVVHDRGLHIRGDCWVVRDPYCIVCDIKLLQGFGIEDPKVGFCHAGAVIHIIGLDGDEDFSIPIAEVNHKLVGGLPEHLRAGKLLPGFQIILVQVLGAVAINVVAHNKRGAGNIVPAGTGLLFPLYLQLVRRTGCFGVVDALQALSTQKLAVVQRTVQVLRGFCGSGQLPGIAPHCQRGE